MKKYLKIHTNYYSTVIYKISTTLLSRKSKQTRQNKTISQQAQSLELAALEDSKILLTN